MPRMPWANSRPFILLTCAVLSAISRLRSRWERRRSSSSTLVAKYMQRTHRRGPSTTWRSFLRQHGSEIWACDFFCVRTITFRTLYVFFVIDHASRQVLHVEVTPNPTASWAAQQMVECCAWDRKPPRFLVRDRDSCYGTAFDRRVRNIGVAQVRTPFRSPRANAIAERWVRSVRTECLDHVFIFNERHLPNMSAISTTGAR